jgi:hypothetical protein
MVYGGGVYRFGGVVSWGTPAGLDTSSRRDTDCPPAHPGIVLWGKQW